MNTNWNEMTARERDAVVAEKVMGWKWYRAQWIGMTYGERNPKLRYLLRSAHPSNAWNFCQIDALEVPVESLKGDEQPNYSTDIASAWLVVERTGKAGWIFELSNVSEDDAEQIGNKLHWTATFEAESKVSICASTAPEAICLAALRAMGVDV